MISEQASFLSPADMMIVMVVALVVFGPAKLPEVGRQLGQALRELKKLTGELTDSLNSETADIKSAFDNVSPYKFKPSPIDSEPKLLGPAEGYSVSEAMKESPLLTHSVDEPAMIEKPAESSGQIAAAAVPLTPVVSNSGDGVK